MSAIIAGNLQTECASEPAKHPYLHLFNSEANTRQALKIEELLNLEFDTLLDLSRQAATRALEINLPTIAASPIIVTNFCTTDPMCRHCKWEHLKAIKRPSFDKDRPTTALVNWAHALADKGIERAFFGTGWLGYRLPTTILKKIEAVCTAEPRLEYYGLFGALDRQTHFDLAAAGLSGMLTSLESPSERVYRSFRPGGDSLSDRLTALEFTREAGMKVWSGFLVGLGEDVHDVAFGLQLLGKIAPESVSILPFEPFAETEMRDHPPTDSQWLARVNAVARLVLPPSTILFSDHYRDVDQRFGHAIGYNGSYQITPPAELITPREQACSTDHKPAREGRKA